MSSKHSPRWLGLVFSLGAFGAAFGAACGGGAAFAMRAAQSVNGPPTMTAVGVALFALIGSLIGFVGIYETQAARSARRKLLDDEDVSSGSESRRNAADTWLNPPSVPTWEAFLMGLKAAPPPPVTTHPARLKQLEELATELNLEYLPQGSRELAESVSESVQLPGRGKKVTDLLRGQSERLTLSVFDYSYISGAKTQKTVLQTVVMVVFPEAWLPCFAMQPKTFLDRLYIWVKPIDLNFPTHPRFSEQYVLWGPDLLAVRRLFQPVVRDYFDRNVGLSVESVENRLMIYRDGKRSAPEEIRSRLKEAFDVMSVFAGNSSR